MYEDEYVQHWSTDTFHGFKESKFKSTILYHSASLLKAIAKPLRKQDIELHYLSCTVDHITYLFTSIVLCFYSCVQHHHRLSFYTLFQKRIFIFSLKFLNCPINDSNLWQLTDKLLPFVKIRIWHLIIIDENDTIDFFISYSWCFW